LLNIKSSGYKSLLQIHVSRIVYEKTSSSNINISGQVYREVKDHPI